MLSLHMSAHTAFNKNHCNAATVGLRLGVPFKEQKLNERPLSNESPLD